MIISVEPYLQGLKVEIMLSEGSVLLGGGNSSLQAESYFLWVISMLQKK